MDKNTITERMHQLESIIGYSFKEIDYLSLSMNATKINSLGKGRHNKEYENSGLATVGDAMLKAVLADYLYQTISRNKGDITIIKSTLENNVNLTSISEDNGIRNFAYNQFHFADESGIPDHEKVVKNSHDVYIEAIIGAIYYDKGFEEMKKWIIAWLLPRLTNNLSTMP